MLCPKCQCEMVIKATRYVTENDNTADAKTELFIEQDLYCRNKRCSDYDKLVQTVRNPIKLG